MLSSLCSYWFLWELDTVLVAESCPYLSVIITSFNQGKLLLEAVDSYERHSNQCSSELLVIDDGSECIETLRILDILETKGYTVLRQENMGLPQARNNALSSATGKVILFLDDDNRLLAPYFTIGLQLMRDDSAIDVVYGDRLEFGEWDRLVQIGDIDPDELWTMNRIDNCALIRHSYLDRCGGYEVKLTGLGFEDWELWLNGLSQESGLKLKYLNLPCFEYRVRSNSMLNHLFKSKELQNRLMEFLKAKYPGRVGHGGFQ